MSTPNTPVQPLSREARAQLLRQRFTALNGWRRWNPVGPTKEKVVTPLRKTQAPNDWSWCVMDTPRLPPWMFREQEEKCIRAELLKIRERGVVTPYTMIMGIFEEARVNCRDLREVSANLENSNRRTVRS